MATLIEALAQRPPPPAPASPDERGIAKHAATIIVAIILGLCMWVGSTVSSLSTAVTKMQGTMDEVQRSVGNLQASQTTAVQQVSDLRTLVAKGDARADAVEADVGRVKERIRILEGQKPIGQPGGPTS